MNKKYNFVYKTTNLINNKIYIGVHSTTNLDDGYLGSGDSLKKAIKKYNKNNFKRDIIQFFDDIKDCYILESKLVDLDFIKNINTYNKTIGGQGGMSNMVIIKKEHNKFSKITKEEFDSNDCLIGSMKDKIVVIDKTTNKIYRINKSEFDENQHIHFFSGKVSTKKMVKI